MNYFIYLINSVLPFLRRYDVLHEIYMDHYLDLRALYLFIYLFI